MRLVRHHELSETLESFRVVQHGPQFLSRKEDPKSAKRSLTEPRGGGLGSEAVAEQLLSDSYR